MVSQTLVKYLGLLKCMRLMMKSSSKDVNTKNFPICTILCRKPSLKMLNKTPCYERKMLKMTDFNQNYMHKHKAMMFFILTTHYLGEIWRINVALWFKRNFNRNDMMQISQIFLCCLDVCAHKTMCVWNHMGEMKNHGRRLKLLLASGVSFSHFNLLFSSGTTRTWMTLRCLVWSWRGRLNLSWMRLNSWRNCMMK